MLHRLKAVASSYGSKPDWSAFGGLRLRHFEVIVWFGWRLVLDILGPHLIGNVAAACNPVTSRPQMLTPVTLADHPELAHHLFPTSPLQIFHPTPPSQTLRSQHPYITIFP